MPSITTEAFKQASKRGERGSKFDWAVKQAFNLEFNEIWGLESVDENGKVTGKSYICDHGKTENGKEKNCPIASAVSRATAQSGLPKRTFKVRHIDNMPVIRKDDTRSEPQN